MNQRRGKISFAPPFLAMNVVKRFGRSFHLVIYKSWKFCANMRKKRAEKPFAYENNPKKGEMCPAVLLHKSLENAILE
jgi:hypothetical protein